MHIDGDIGRTTGAGASGPEYASASLGADTFVDFDLGVVRPVGGFDFFDRPADEDRVTGFDIILSQNATFGDGDDIVKSYTNSNMAMGDVFGAAVSARYIRFDVTSNLGGPSANTGISEIVFYQVPEPAGLASLALGISVVLTRGRATRLARN